MNIPFKYVDPQLISNTKPFMYTEFPHKRYWSTKFEYSDYNKLLETLPPNSPSMLYVHIPYCEQLCWFCTCHMIITKDYEMAKSYLKSLYQEISILRQLFEKNHNLPDFQEIHLGGGSPTFIREQEFDELVNTLSSIVNMGNLKEFSIEVDPRRVDQKRMRYYHSKGINRVSFGIQDFDPKVQEAVNRIQPAELIENLLTEEIRELFSNGINFDLICGLPWQTTETLKETCQRVVKIAPDRICLNYLHYVPEHTKHQSLMSDGKHNRPNRLPDGYERKELFMSALDILTAEGYIRTGYDHFVKPTDEVARAMRENKMGWNALGVTSGRYLNTFGIGISSISEVNNSYAQNHYQTDIYSKDVSAGNLPIFRGHILTRDDIIRRDIIQKIRTYFSINLSEIEKQYDIIFRDYFRDDIKKLNIFIADELAVMSDDSIVVTEKGQQFANLVCTCFDPYFSQ